jgi:uncharacterized RDD family membrane protein YckC
VSASAPENAREILTPEGVPLRFTVANPGDRAAAFLIDGLVITAMVGGLVVLLLLALLGGGRSGAGWLASFALLAAFVVRNFYFVGFELRWQGRTPGKRALGIRVMDRRGGPLTGEAVFARNLTRDLEVFLPLTVATNPALFSPGAPGLAALAAWVWLFLFAFLPLFNRDRLRVGDLIAGTLVVVAPKGLLLEDLSGASRPGSRPKEDLYSFTPEQLDLYGIYELQVLEDLLRKDMPDRRETLEAVCGKIQAKIGWPDGGTAVDPERFLLEFYTAQRARLEHKMLLGQRRERKRSGRLGRGRDHGGNVDAR